MPLLRRASPSLLAVAVGLLLAHHAVLLSGGARVQGDPGDVRFVAFCLEHVWAWFHRAPLHARFWDLPAFYPAPGTHAYSDVVFGVAPPYWLARAAGAGPERAFVLWLLATTSLNVLAGAFALRRLVGASPAAALAGAVLVAAGAPRIHAVNHPQLLGCWPAWLVLGLLAVAFRAPGSRAARWAWPAAALAFSAQLWSSYYLAWFLAFALALALLGTLADWGLRSSLTRAVSRDRLAVLTATAVALGLCAPLVHAWWTAARSVGLRPYGDVFLPRGQSWFFLGTDSWIWGWLGGMRGLQRTPVAGEQMQGVGVLTLVVAAVGLWRSRRRPAVALVLGVAIALVLLSMQWRWGGSAWRLVWAAVPGARAVRAVPRIGLVVLMALGAGLALAWDGLARRRSAGWSAGVAALCLAEQGVSGPTFAPAREASRVAVLAAAVDPSCSAFLYAPVEHGAPAWIAQLDAMWAAERAGVPTLNGYSGNVPPGWPFEDVVVHGPGDARRIDDGLASWTRASRLTGAVCVVTGTPEALVKIPPGSGLSPRAP